MTVVRNLLKEHLKTIDGNFAIFASGGIDSCSILACAADLKLSPTVISFTLADRLSHDFRFARLMARHYKLEFLPIYLPINKEIILKDVSELIKKYKLNKKTKIECLWPMLLSLKVLNKKGIKNIVTGLGADGHFGLSKKVMIHYKEPKKKFQKYKAQYFNDPTSAGIAYLKNIASDFDIKVFNPYFHKDFMGVFNDLSWDELNKPRQKEIIRRDFPELIKFKVKNHTNLQLGDSGIADTVGNAVKTLVAPNAKSVVTAYNMIAKQ